MRPVTLTLNLTLDQELAGNCPQYVSLKALEGVGGAIKQFATTDAYCEKNCRAGFCPEAKVKPSPSR